MFRMYYEMRDQTYPGYFITMTYDEKHVPRIRGTREHSLRFRDVQLFLKQVRRAKFYVKYVVVGEYGPQTARPHYHAILWTNGPLDRLEKIWCRGRFHVGRLEMASVMYTLKYIIQPKSWGEDRRERPRAQFSKGLGLSYLTTAVYNYHTRDYDNPVVVGMVDGKTVGLPRYYKNKIFTKHQMRLQCSKTKWEAIRERRKYMRELIAQGVKNTKVYITKMRVEEARRILKNVKYNQTL